MRILQSQLSVILHLMNDSCAKCFQSTLISDFSSYQFKQIWKKKLPGHSSDASDDSGAAGASADPEAMMPQSLLKSKEKNTPIIELAL